MTRANQDDYVYTKDNKEEDIDYIYCKDNRDNDDDDDDEDGDDNDDDDGDGGGGGGGDDDGGDDDDDEGQGGGCLQSLMMMKMIMMTKDRGEQCIFLMCMHTARLQKWRHHVFTKHSVQGQFDQKKTASSSDMWRYINTWPNMGYNLFFYCQDHGGIISKYEPHTQMKNTCTE